MKNVKNVIRVENYFGHVDEYLILFLENGKVAVLRDGRTPKEFRSPFWALKYIEWVEMWGILRDTLKYWKRSPK